MPNYRNNRLENVVSFNFIFGIIFFSVFVSVNTGFSQNKNYISRINNENIPREKIYLHTDKTFYNSGDDIWFKAYLVDAATLKPEALSKVAYVDLIDPSGEILITKTINVTDGCGNGDFKLRVNLTGGEYTLRAYTTYMRNFDKAFFFREKINISPVLRNLAELQDSTHKTLPDQKTDSISSQKPDVQFFPEGGYLVCGFPCNIGVKAVVPNGKGIDVTGVIFDSTGKKMTEFSTLKFGLGMVQLMPLQGEAYKARITWNNTEYEYELPLALENGAVMQVAEQEEFYHVVVHSSLPNRIKNFSFVGTQKNSVLFDTKITSDDEGIILKVPKNMFKEGVAQFTLFDGNNNPCCERLVFVETNDMVSKLSLTTSKEEYGKKELVDLDISTDELALPQPEGSMSVAVAPVSEMSDNSETDIKSYLLLNSELKGEIEHPGYYFYSDDTLREKVLDLLMMTQGWRRYIWNEPQIRDTAAFVFHPETGLRFEGEITRLSYLMKSSEAVVSLTCNNQYEFSQYETDADENGHFKFDGIAFEDSTSVIIQAKRERKKGKNPAMNYTIELDELAPPKETTEYFPFTYSNNEILNNKPFPSKFNREEIDSLYNLEKTDIVLEEIIVNAKKPNRIAEKRTLYHDPSYSVNVSEIYKKFKYPDLGYLMNGRVPGIEVHIDKEVHSRLIYMKNHGPGYSIPILYLNDAPSTLDEILMLPLSEIHFVDVLKPGPKTVIYGTAGQSGVIAVYTLDPEERLNLYGPKERKGIINFTHPGFSKAREFYTPVYTSKKSKEKPDYRTTLYWNPALKLDRHGKAKISFYTSDISSAYKIILEGILSEGDIIHKVNYFDVK